MRTFLPSVSDSVRDSVWEDAAFVQATCLIRVSCNSSGNRTSQGGVLLQPCCVQKTSWCKRLISEFQPSLGDSELTSLGKAMAKKTLADLPDLHGKRVLIRVDFNVP